MKRKFQRLAVKLTEASTWRGLVMVLTAVGVQLHPDQQEAIVTIGLGLAGLIGILVSDDGAESK